MLKSESVTIQPPNLKVAVFRIVGTAPYVQHKFSAKAKQMMIDKQAAGSVAKKGAKRDPKDFDALYKGAMHFLTDGSHGIPAPAFRAAMVSACRVVGFKMTLAKLSLFIEADGFDDEGTPLVKMLKGKPHRTDLAVRLETGVIDIRPRPMWDAGWEADVRIRFDADQFSVTDVANLLMRVGTQVGIGEGRPDSPNSCGMGWGLFSVNSKK
jgi:hypothetical protein